jgi:MoxR-like ATPase
VIERLIIGLLADGHLLVEGLPGLAKTRAVKSLARHLDAPLSRIQFTPDLLPSDVTGSEVYYQTGGAGEFKFQPGPVFSNLVLADEINRAPAKVQAALLEAMEERQVTVAGTTHPLPPLFLVMATQNPIEQEGTYPLPEAQMDRFLMHVMIGYPDEEAEQQIVRLVRGEEAAAPKADAATETPVPQQTVFDARAEVHAIAVAPAIEKYVADLIFATRYPERYGDDLRTWIRVGASPRGSLALDPLCTRPRVAAGPRSRDARRRARRPERLPPPSPHPELRGAGRRPHGRRRAEGDRDQGRRRVRGAWRRPASTRSSTT